MTELITLTDANFEETLINGKPVLLVLSDGNLRGEFSIAFKKAATEHNDIIFATIEAHTNPIAAKQFNVTDKAVLIAYHQGETLARRKRPWGADVVLAIEMLKKSVAESATASNGAEPVEQEQKITKSQEEKRLVDTKSVIVTDANFQQEVVDYDLPVLVDFWAEWCGPCRMVTPILEKLAGEYSGKVRIAKVNVDENPGLSQYFKVQSIPTIMMFKERTMVFNQPGALPEPAFRQLLDQLVELEIPEQTETEEEAQPE